MKFDNKLLRICNAMQGQINLYYKHGEKDHDALLLSNTFYNLFKEMYFFMECNGGDYYINDIEDFIRKRNEEITERCALSWARTKADSRRERG